MVYNFNNKYSQSTLSKFDIIGSYFVNLYYNEFYIKAKNLKTQGNSSNLTEAYKNVLSSYVEFSNHQDFFKQIVKGIHTYCISTTRYTTMSHKECIDFMVSEFVPDNLWSSLRENQKNKLFHESLINCIKIFTEKIICNHLHIIIDNHGQGENITILQDLFLNIILLEKDTIFSKFINPKNNNNIELFREKLQNLLNDKKKIASENKELSDKFKILTILNQKNIKIITELQKSQKTFLKEFELLKKENFLINQKNIELKKQLNKFKNSKIMPESGDELHKFKIETQKKEIKYLKHEIESLKSELSNNSQKSNNSHQSNLTNLSNLSKQRLNDDFDIKSTNSDIINDLEIESNQSDLFKLDDETDIIKKKIILIKI